MLIRRILYLLGIVNSDIVIEAMCLIIKYFDGTIILLNRPKIVDTYIIGMQIGGEVFVLGSDGLKVVLMDTLEVVL
jgi:hypothetical protein